MSVRLRTEGGFSLPELLVTLTIAMTVSMAAFALVEYVMKRSAEAEQRVETTQRGRIALETITRQLRSQVCLTRGNTSYPPIVSGTGTQISLYVDLSDAASTAQYPERHDLTYNTTAKTIVEQDYATVDGVNWALQRTRTLLTNVNQDRDTAGNVLPVFKYSAYSYDAASDPQLSLAELTPPLGANNGRVVKIEVAFRATPRAKTYRSDVEVPFRDDVFVRAVNPNELSTGSADPAPVPTCA
jgi:type II secretory pathway component PulJ